MNVFAFAGALRKESFNRKLIRVAARIAREAGHTVDLADGRELDVPLYDGDLEAASGLPEGVKALSGRIDTAGAVLLSTPEYNHSIPGVLKNAIDWVSRRKPVQSWKGKPILILSATPGPFGAVSSSENVRQALSAAGAFVHPLFYNLPHADEAFDTDGTLKDAKRNDRLKAMVVEFLASAAKLTGTTK